MAEFQIMAKSKLNVKKPRILCIGSMNIDMVVKTDRIPSAGETLLGGVFARHFGGKGANQAVAAKMLYGDTSFCSGVGGDPLGAEYMERFAKLGLDASLVKKFPKAHTGVAIIMVGSRGENAISVAPGANYMLGPRHLDSVDFSKFTHVLLQLEIPFETVLAALSKARAAGCLTILTPAPARLLPREMLPLIDYLVPNEHEIMLLQRGYTFPRKAAEGLVRKGVKNVIITLGANGALLINSSGEKRYETYDVKPVDTVGAGDCFTGSLAAGLCLYGGDMDRAVGLAMGAASLAVGKAGAQSYHSLRAVKKFMAECS